MKATGIVRRIDSSVIILAKGKSLKCKTKTLKTWWFSLIFVHFINSTPTEAKLPAMQRKVGKGGKVNNLGYIAHLLPRSNRLAGVLFLMPRRGQREVSM